MKLMAMQNGCRLHCGPHAWDLTKDSHIIRMSRAHYAGVPQLARDFDDLFDALLPVETGNLLLLDFSWPHIHTYRDSGLRFEFAKWPDPDASFNTYLDNYRPSLEDVVFDLGAQYGVSTYWLSEVCGYVLALEQESGAREILARNMERHALANVLVAGESTASIAELIKIYGAPAYCRINLNRVSLEFLLSEADTWTSTPMLIGARGTSKPVRTRFAKFLVDSGFVIAIDNDAGMIWASPGALPNEG